MPNLSQRLSCRLASAYLWCVRRSAFMTIASILLIVSENVLAGDLHDAVRANDAQRLGGLLDAGQAIDETDFVLGTPLHVAVAQGSVPLARILLSHGASIDARICIGVSE